MKLNQFLFFFFSECICFCVSFDTNIYLRGPLVRNMPSLKIQEHFQSCQKSNRLNLANVTGFSTAWCTSARYKTKFSNSSWYTLFYGLYIHLEPNLHQDIPVAYCSLSLSCPFLADVIFLLPNCKGALEQEYPW